MRLVDIVERQYVLKLVYKYRMTIIWNLGTTLMQFYSKKKERKKEKTVNALNVMNALLLYCGAIVSPYICISSG